MSPLFKEKSFVDVGLMINNVVVKFNNSLIEWDDVKVEKEGESLEWHHLVMRSSIFPQGDLAIEIASVKNKVTSDLRNIIVSANVALSFA